MEAVITLKQGNTITTFVKVPKHTTTFYLQQSYFNKEGTYLVAKMSNDGNPLIIKLEPYPYVFFSSFEHFMNEANEVNTIILNTRRTKEQLATRLEVNGWKVINPIPKPDYRDHEFYTNKKDYGVEFKKWNDIQNTLDRVLIYTAYTLIDDYRRPVKIDRE